MTSIPFSGASASPWMPGLAAELAPREWTRIEGAFGLDRESYGTARYVRRDRSAPRRVLAELFAPAAPCSPGPVVIEELDGQSSAHYRAMGLSFADGAEIVRMDAATRLIAASAIIARIPDLAAAIGHLLAAVHVLRAPDADHDVSHSDPDVPFSVFIGMSPESSGVDRLRLAEALVHECMHLQLTLLERRCPLVIGIEELHASPWQGRPRPTRGILHGFYVFTVVGAFFARLLAEDGLSSLEASHAMSRRRDIAAEIEVAARALAGSDELTAAGRNLVSALDGRRSADG